MLCKYLVVRDQQVLDIANDGDLGLDGQHIAEGQPGLVDFCIWLCRRWVLLEPWQLLSLLPSMMLPVKVSAADTLTPPSNPSLQDALLT